MLNQMFEGHMRFWVQQKRFDFLSSHSELLMKPERSKLEQLPMLLMMPYHQDLGGLQGLISFRPTE